MRYFNTTGPVKCDKHYCIPPLERFDLEEILLLIQQEKYFVLHAPRQTGKTTYLLALMAHLNQTEEYRALYINVEAAQAEREDIASAMRIILNQLAVRSQKFLRDNFLTEHKSEILHQAPNDTFDMALTLWAEATPKPIVLLIDEIDSLIGDTLISVLRQLRGGYDKRPQFFPQSVVLCGVRDVRDYRMHTDEGKAMVTGGSAFNIKAKSLRMGNFSQTEVETLYQQHTEATGQRFEPAAMNLLWELTQGQPWLVNALGYDICFEMKMGRDRSRPITADMVIQAKENLILRRETHLDQLVDKLKEKRVHRVMNPILQGVDLGHTVRPDDVQYVMDLGLVTRAPQGLQIANPIYREIIPRELNQILQLNFESKIQPAWYIANNGRLDMDKLLTGFQQFFREHSEHWVERFNYKEAGPQLLLQAFLQRVVNSGGRIEREYGLGRRRTDLLVLWPYSSSSGEGGGVQRVAIELKILHKSLEKTLAEGLSQTWAYMDKCGTSDGHLVIFDRSPGRSWEEKIFKRLEVYRGQEITVWGM